MKSLLRLFGLLLLSAAALAQDTGKIFVVRHAEKQSDDSDSPLNDKGLARAQCLAQTLKEAQIKTVFTTHLQRTKQTAAPLEDLAHAKHVTLDDQKEISEQSVAAAKTGNVLIVGHSNTIPKILYTIGTPGVTIPDDAFDQLFIFDAAHPKEMIILHYCPTLPKDTATHSPNSMAKPQ